VWFGKSGAVRDTGLEGGAGMEKRLYSMTRTIGVRMGIEMRTNTSKESCIPYNRSDQIYTLLPSHSCNRKYPSRDFHLIDPTVIHSIPTPCQPS